MNKQRALLGLIVAVTGIVIICIIWLVPLVQLADLRSQVERAPTAELSTKDYLALKKDLIQAEAGARATIAQILGGFVLLAGLYFTREQLSDARVNQATRLPEWQDDGGERPATTSY